jgi:hypothetical protein
LGESVQVRVCDTQEETSKLLSKVLNGRQGAADILAKLVHSEVSPDDDKSDSKLDLVPDNEENFNVDDLGIWIDPIGKRNITLIKQPFNNKVNEISCRWN